MALRLQGASSGYIELKAPASAGDNTLTLPTNNGSANTFLKTDGSGNLSWQSNLTFDGTSLKIGNNFSAHSEGDDLVIGGSGWRGMTIYGEGGGGVIQFADDAGNRDGQIMYDHTNRQMMIRTAGNANRLIVKSDGSTLLSGLSTNNDTRNVAGLVLKSPAGISFQGYGSNNSRNWRLRPDDLTAWGALEFSVSPTANDNNDWPDAAGDAVLVLEASKDVVVKNGNLKIGLAGKGIDFSAQTPTAATGATTGDEVLDHYEEGTFTPYIDREFGNSPILGYDAQDGYYTRIGRVVHFYMEIRVSSYNGNGSYGTTFLRGLPFNAAARTGGRGGWDSVTLHTYNTGITTTDGEVDIAVVGANTEKVELYIMRNEDTWTDIPAPDANDQYKVGGYYFV